MVLVAGLCLVACRREKAYRFDPPEVDTTKFEYVAPVHEEIKEEWEDEPIMEIPEYHDPDITGEETHVLEEFMKGNDVGD